MLHLMAKETQRERLFASPGPWAIALAGLVSLAVAVGIERFAFTPLLPMMLNDGVVDLPAASWLASANYLGYMLGAMLCTLQPWLWARFKWLPLPGLLIAGARRAGGHGGVDARHGMAVSCRVAGAALCRRRDQRGGVCLHVGLVPVSPCKARRTGAGRGDLCRTGRGHCRERPVCQRHGGLALERCDGLDDFWCAGVCSHQRGMAHPAGRRRAPGCAGS